jgi:hypothetical protein
MRDENAGRHEFGHLHDAEVDVQVRLQSLDDAPGSRQP